ncbi:MAG: (d)CMP kinase [Slackia sp.]|nr:(d)CMP kinase [Slackia sp.]
MIIAIDGPSGAGKSTVAKSVAKKLGFSCLDTGAMYRCIAWCALEEQADLSDGERLGAIAREKEISFGHVEGDPVPRRVFVDGVEVTDAIRTATIDKSVSTVSAHPPVRAALVDQQRRIGNAGDFVIEGRDIGTVVFPNAEVKVFLTASNEERARRRVLQNEQRGVGSVDFDEVLADIVRRDEQDSNRATAPLVAADDAVAIDSTGKTIDDVIEDICERARALRRDAE